MTINVERLKDELTDWLQASRVETLRLMEAPVDVSTKTSKRDLVTNVDRAIQAFLLTRIRAAYPDAQVIGEEGFADHELNLNGLVFFVDPIDGTMNFVKMRKNFATMVGVYLDGKPLIGAILDVIADKLIVGGPSLSVTENGQPLEAPADLALDEGLIGLSGPLAIKNVKHIGDVGLMSAGTRVIGSAGMEFLAIARGEVIGYISRLAPWDIAAGMAIGASFGLKVTKLNGDAVDFSGRELTLAAMPRAYSAILPEVGRD